MASTELGGEPSCHAPDGDKRIRDVFSAKGLNYIRIVASLNGPDQLDCCLKGTNLVCTDRDLGGHPRGLSSHVSFQVSVGTYFSDQLRRERKHFVGGGGDVCLLAAQVAVLPDISGY